MEQDFEPQTAKVLASPDEYRLLILDGHNSHCTFRLCSFAREHKIIIVCLPPHTTHVLQPCDVLVFSPLQRAWRKQVRKAGKVTKNTFLTFYDAARQEAFKVSTIITSFAITGIHPLNRTVITEDKFEPATNTTTEEVVLFPSLPSIIPMIHESGDSINESSEFEPDVVLFNHTHQSVQTTVSILPAPSSTMYIGPPPALPTSSSKELFITQNRELRNITETLYSQVQTDRMQLHICTLEIDRLRRLAYTTGHTAAKAKADGSGARHMTSEQALKALEENEAQAEAKEAEKVQRLEDREKKKLEKQARDDAKAAAKEAAVQKRQEAAILRRDEAARKAADRELERAMRGLVAAEKANRPARRQRRVAAIDGKYSQVLVLKFELT